MTPIPSAKPSPPKGRSPSSPTTRHERSNIRSTGISTPSATWWSVVSQNSSNSAVLQPASKRPHAIPAQSYPSQPSSYGCDKCPHNLERPALGSNRSGIERSRYCGAHIEILWLLPERMWMLKPIPQTGVSDGRVEPSSPPHDRGHDGPEYVARDPAILHQRGFKVQPLFW